MFTINHRNLYTEDTQAISTVMNINAASKARYESIPTAITKCSVIMTPHQNSTNKDCLVLDITFPKKQKTVMGYTLNIPLNCIGYLYNNEVMKYFSTLQNIEANKGKATIYVAKLQLDANHFNVYASFSETELANSIASINTDKALEKALEYEAKQEAKRAAKAAYVAPEEEAETMTVTCSNSGKYKKCEKCNMTQAMTCKHFKA